MHNTVTRLDRNDKQRKLFTEAIIRPKQRTAQNTSALLLDDVSQYNYRIDTVPLILWY